MRKEVHALKDAIFHAGRLLDDVSSVSLDEFRASFTLRDVAILNLQHLAQHVKDLPDDWRAMQPHIPWTKAAGLRNLMVHDYHHVDLATIHKICVEDVAVLQQALKEIAREVSGPLLAQDDLPE